MDIATAAFWLALGAWLVAGALAPWLKQREIQRTIRAMIEKNGAIDGETLALISNRDPEGQSRESLVAKAWGTRPEHGLAGLILFVAIIAGFVLMAYFLSVQPSGWIRAVHGAGALIGMVTLGLFVAWLVGRGEKKGDKNR